MALMRREWVEQTAALVLAAWQAGIALVLAEPAAEPTADATYRDAVKALHDAAIPAYIADQARALLGYNWPVGQVIMDSQALYLDIFRAVAEMGPTPAFDDTDWRRFTEIVRAYRAGEHGRCGLLAETLGTYHGKVDWYARARRFVDNCIPTGVRI